VSSPKSCAGSSAPPDVVIANNVMAHVPDLNDFVAGLARLVDDHGIVQIENPGVGYLLGHNEFDTIYHEHFCYFSTIAVDRLFRCHGLVVTEVDVFPSLHGGTLRWTAATHSPVSSTVRRQLEEERRRLPRIR